MVSRNTSEHRRRAWTIQRGNHANPTYVCVNNRNHYVLNLHLHRFSALKMDGKPLYEYARTGLPLPRPIPPRTVTVHSLEIVDWTEGTAHQFRWPERVLSSADREKMKRALEGAIRSENVMSSIDDVPDPSVKDETPRPPTFVLTMKVSGGTYVRSLAHDIGHAVGSAAHVVTLTRVRQGDFTLEPNKEQDRACVPWEIFEEAVKEDEDPEEKAPRDQNGHRKWEAQILERLVLFENDKYVRQAEEKKGHEA